jgi:hypothetical protein
MGPQRARAIALCTAVLLAASPAAFPQDAAAGPRSPFVFDLTAVMWGGDVGAGWRGWPLFPGVDTILWAWAGASAEDVSFYRMPDGSLITGAAPAGVDPVVDPYSWRWSGRWRLGAAQGITRSPRTGDNLLEAFGYWRARVDANLRDPAVPAQLAFLSADPARFGSFQNALLAGLRWRDVSLDRVHKTRSGLSAEATVEWGPPFLANELFGATDYVRLNATARGFLPLFTADRGDGRNLFSLYAADFLSADWAFGPVVPWSVRQSFGGTDQRTGLGDAVRGVDFGSCDTAVKAVNNLELRATLPALVLPDLVPGILVFWDSGLWAQAGEGREPVPWGFLSSVGTGVFLDFLDLTSFVAYLCVRLTGVNADGTAVTPPWALAALSLDLKF